MLDCPAGSFPNLRNTACVANSCPEPPLTPLVDAATLGFEDGNRWQPDFLTTGPTGYQAKLACVQNTITAKGWTYTGTSAYRPHPYQKHLLEVVKKDEKLSTKYMTKHPECQTLRDEISREMGGFPGHALTKSQAVASKISQHEKGQAFDLTPHPPSAITVDATKAQMLPIYSACGVANTKVPLEPWHVQ